MKKIINGVYISNEDDENDEIEFELNYLRSLTLQERFRLMETRSREIKRMLEQNGHRKTPEIIKH